MSLCRTLPAALLVVALVVAPTVEGARAGPPRPGPARADAALPAGRLVLPGLPIVVPRADARRWSFRVDAPYAVRVRPIEGGLEDDVIIPARPEREELVYRVDVQAFAGLRLVDDVLELLDAGGAPRGRMRAPVVIARDGARAPVRVAIDDCAVDTSPAPPWGRAPVRPGRDVCAVRLRWGDAIGAPVAYPIVVDPAWVDGGTLALARHAHAATLLADGRVLVAGGVANLAAYDYFTSAEMYDPATRSWATVAPMLRGRAHFDLVRLTRGPHAGWVVAPGSDNDFERTAERFDPTTGEWTATGAMQVARDAAEAVELHDGRVLAAGGCRYEDPQCFAERTAEVYDPATDVWTATEDMAEARAHHDMVVLADGSALAIGGCTQFANPAHCYTSTRGVERFDPTTGAWDRVAQLPTYQQNHMAVVLSDGRVLSIGGTAHGTVIKASQIYDPIEDAWTLTQPLLWEHDEAAAAVLADGSVLVAGGWGTNQDFNEIVRDAELFDVASERWVPVAPLRRPHGSHQMVAFADGTALVVSGLVSSNTTPTAEVYDPTIPTVCPGAPALGATCESCVAAQCCDAVAMLEHDGGAGLVACLEGCGASSESEACRDQCEAQCPGGKPPSYEALRHCVNDRCDGPCAKSYGDETQPSPQCPGADTCPGGCGLCQGCQAGSCYPLDEACFCPPATFALGAEACDACAARECCSALAACRADKGCELIEACIARCGPGPEGQACVAACGAACPDGAPWLDALSGCLVDRCGESCAGVAGREDIVVAPAVAVCGDHPAGDVSAEPPAESTPEASPEPSPEAAAETAAAEATTASADDGGCAGAPPLSLGVGLAAGLALLFVRRRRSVALVALALGAACNDGERRPEGDVATEDGSATDAADDSTAVSDTAASDSAATSGTDATPTDVAADIVLPEGCDFAGFDKVSESYTPEERATIDPDSHTWADHYVATGPGKELRIDIFNGDRTVGTLPAPGILSIVTDRTFRAVSGEVAIQKWSPATRTFSGVVRNARLETTNGTKLVWCVERFVFGRACDPYACPVATPICDSATASMCVASVSSCSSDDAHEPNNGPSQATELALDTPLSASICQAKDEAAGESDWYTFEVPEDDRVVHVTLRSDTPGATLTSVISARDADIEVVPYVPRDGVFDFVTAPLSAGRYELAVRQDTNTIAAYTIEVSALASECTRDDECPAARPVCRDDVRRCVECDSFVGFGCPAERPACVMGAADAVCAMLDYCHGDDEPDDDDGPAAARSIGFGQSIQAHLCGNSHDASALEGDWYRFEVEATRSVELSVIPRLGGFGFGVYTQAGVWVEGASDTLVRELGPGTYLVHVTVQRPITEAREATPYVLTLEP